jgi:hypothetical protein
LRCPGAGRTRGAAAAVVRQALEEKRRVGIAGQSGQDARAMDDALQPRRADGDFGRYDVRGIIALCRFGQERVFDLGLGARVRSSRPSLSLGLAL